MNRCASCQATRFVETTDRWLAEVELGLTTWAGDYEGFDDVWLRWVDRNGVMLATGPEAKLQEQVHTEEERQKAEQERQKMELLAAKLRELGIDPDALTAGAAQ
jgi:hypothetical protein